MRHFRSSRARQQQRGDRMGCAAAVAAIRAAVARVLLDVKRYLRMRSR